MIEPIFNEFSAYPLCEDVVADEKFHTLASLLKHLEIYGIKRVRYEDKLSDIPFTKTQNLGDYCFDIIQNRTSQNAKKQNEVNLLYGRIKPPFLKDGEELNVDGIASATHTYQKENNQGILETVSSDALSLLSAYLLNTFTIGYDNNVPTPCKLNLKYISEEEGQQEEVIKEVTLVCVCTEADCFADKAFIEMLSDQKDLPVKKTQTRNDNFTLPAHHGLKECTEHGKALLRTDYVKDILSSRSFNGGDDSYITRVNPDGSIEVRLYWTAEGYGLLISTSAENIVQAHWVAKYLNNRFGKKH